MSNKIKRIKFRRSDVLRALLTDTLPYEVPLLFSNHGLYRHLHAGADAKLRNDCNLDLLPENHWSVPYTYNIKKDSLDFRSLSIAHPAAQRNFCNFYKEYGQLIVGLCSRSSFTLRRPVKVATHYYEKARTQKNNKPENSVEVEQDGFSHQDRHASSYFSYQRYNLIHKFYESKEFHGLERKFKLLRRLDISKCFNHIYTHSIAWAAKSKQFGKDNQVKETFEGQFDALMQNANYNETNGIVIGPEVSRIFAEIILQSVDSSVQENLSSNYIAGQHYDVRRYVDDYFVFANDERTLDTIQSTIAKRLSEFKLYLNTTKTNTQSRPFVTGQTGAKIELAALVDRMFEQHTRTARAMREALKEYDASVAAGTVGKKSRPFPVKYVGNASSLAASYIRDMKQVISRNQTDFDSVSNYFFSIAIRKTIDLIERIDLPSASAKEIERLARLLHTILDVLFFAYAMSPRVRATYQISSLCFALSEYCAVMPRDSREYLKGIMADQMRGILHEAIEGGDGDNIEVINLVTVLRSFGDEYLLSAPEILDVYGIQLGEANELQLGKTPFGYFQIVTLLHYIGDSPKYAGILDAICSHVQGRFDSETQLKAIQRNAELTLLAFDFLRCPYIENIRKEHFAKELLRKSSTDNLKGRLPVFLDLIAQGDWFFAWDKRNALGELLWKKELRTAY
ncbi:antiviral reverse transcriptase Drt3b [Burkholderia cenocepacia]|uniref:antiviral reverse transcriptase Drt3b n=1 Tax=Burkholderia cenocepacia TaxID=95486 RepID=UPI00264E4A4E|nr:antiviral reverse transcriptase Drt3b [Burkholderia cenocepacia]MDN7549478.1 antiviral reverse transcriptase Drt3b [Burkholderia cenocepacia]MDN7631414.1 antiviral reverse transcriptase Drt3b [Burkholderia cenocepacia]